MFIVCDTDFLSSFLKIDRLDLVKRLFKEENLHIPRAVLLELAKTNLIIKLLKLEKWGSARGNNPPQFIEGIHGPLAPAFTIV